MRQPSVIMPTPRDSLTIHLRSGCLRAILFALLWWVFTDGAMGSWLVGVPVILFSTLLSVMLLPPFSWSLSGIARFAAFFLWRSLRGGVDVARRALHPRLPISPGLFDYRFRLPPGPSRVFMANTVSLLPGTLSIELNEETLCIHVLDETRAFVEELTVLENHVAEVFGLDLSGSRNEA